MLARVRARRRSPAASRCGARRRSPAGGRGALRELVRAARRREPVAYIVGRARVLVAAARGDDGVLMPRPETEMLVEAALRLAPARASAVLDCRHRLGRGGARARERAAEARGLGHRSLAPRRSPSRARQRRAPRAAACGSSPAACSRRLRASAFDLVVSNPPYCATTSSPAWRPRCGPTSRARRSPPVRTGSTCCGRWSPRARGVLPPGGGCCSRWRRAGRNGRGRCLEAAAGATADIVVERRSRRHRRGCVGRGGGGRGRG